MVDGVILPKFEDVHAAFSIQGYTVTNEEPWIFSDMLKGRRVRRAASIASGGEIPLFVLLPKCREVVAVDHSYQSLASCVIKVALLQSMPVPELREMLWKQDGAKLDGIVGQIKQQLPAVLKSASIYTFGMADLRNHWLMVPEAVMAKTVKNLSRLTLVHGDLSDLSKYGKFDLLYLSNAREHANRVGKNPQLTDFKDILQDNGVLLETYNNTHTVYTGEWKATDARRGLNTSWTHQLVLKQPPASSTATQGALV